jgi:phage terminase small subunit
MSGKPGRSGRPRLHSPDDGDVLTLPALEAMPEKPVFSSPDASQLWDDVAESLYAKGALTIVDLALLKSTCQLYGLYCRCLPIAEADPIDKDARIAVTSYWAKFEQGCARFGMNPSDRQKLKERKSVKPVIAARQRG